MGVLKIINKNNATYDNFVELSLEKYMINKKSTDLIISIGSSFSTLKENFPLNTEKNNHIHFKFIIDEENLIKDYIHLKKYQQFIFEEGLEKFSKENIKINRIHLFYLGGISFAFSIATAISEFYNTNDIIVYYYCPHSIIKYPWGMNLKNKELVKLK